MLTTMPYLFAYGVSVENYRPLIYPIEGNPIICKIWDKYDSETNHMTHIQNKHNNQGLGLNMQQKENQENAYECCCQLRP